MTDDGAPSLLLERVPTHVPGLDVLLCGGLFRGGIYMVAGEPGTGKTILANQACYGHVAAGGQALYLTLLSETHARMLAEVQPMHFFDESTLGQSLQYIGGYQTLEADRLEGLLRLLRKELRAQRTTLLVIDGLVTAHAFSDSDIEMKCFIHELQVMLEMLGCTALVLTGTTSGLTQYSQRTMVDGLLMLKSTRMGMRVVRELEVSKHRGSAQLLGGHIYEISNAGMTVHPRLETVLAAEPAAALGWPLPLLETGTPYLDSLMSGGVVAGSTSLLLGPAGIEKLGLGLQFVRHGATAEAPGLFVTSLETPKIHLAGAQGQMLGLAEAMHNKSVSVLWIIQQDDSIDQIITRMLERIDTLGVKRLFIDGAQALRACLIYPERAYDVFCALGRALHARGVTTMLTDDVAFGPSATGDALQVPFDVRGLVDYMLCIRRVEHDAQMRCVLTRITAPVATKAAAMRELFVTDHNVHIASDASSAQQLLSDACSARPGALGLG